MITFTTFHVDINKDAIKEDTPLDKNNFYNYQLALNLMFKSAGYFHPNCRKVVLSNLNTDLSYLSTDVEVYRYEFDLQQIMYSRLLCQLQFLQHHDFQTDVIFLDSDIIINSNLEDIFAKQDFDLALTFRKFPIMPINGGIIYISKQHKNLVIDFFQKVLNIYQNKYLENAQWWGDQYALAETIGYHNLQNIASDFKLDLEGVNIRLLDCDTYNFSPDYMNDLDVFCPLNQRVIHFKGPRKKFMELYWNYHFQKISDDYLRNIIGQFLQKNNEHREQIQELLASKNELKQIARRLKEERHDFNKNIHNLKEKKEKLQARVQQIELKNNELITQVSNLNSLQSKLQQTNENLKQKRDELIVKVENLIGRQEQSQQTINDLQREKEQLISKVEALGSREQQLQQTINDLETEKEQLFSQTETLQTDKMFLESEKERLLSENLMMKSSKFWQMREKWFAVKRWLRLSE